MFTAIEIYRQLLSDYELKITFAPHWESLLICLVWVWKLEQPDSDISAFDKNFLLKNFNFFLLDQV